MYTLYHPNISLISDFMITAPLTSPQSFKGNVPEREISPVASLHLQSLTRSTGNLDAVADGTGQYNASCQQIFTRKRSYYYASAFCEAANNTGPNTQINK